MTALHRTRRACFIVIGGISPHEQCHICGPSPAVRLAGCTTVQISAQRGRVRPGVKPCCKDAVILTQSPPLLANRCEAVLAARWVRVVPARQAWEESQAEFPACGEVRIPSAESCVRYAPCKVSAGREVVRHRLRCYGSAGQLPAPGPCRQWVWRAFLQSLAS